MRVRAVVTFKTRSGTVPAGTIFDVDQALLPKLGTLVEIITVSTPVDLFKMTGEILHQVDRQGRPWDGFYEALTAADRQQLRNFEAEVDRAVLAGDHEAARQALDNYHRLLVEMRRRLH